MCDCWQSILKYFNSLPLSPPSLPPPLPLSSPSSPPSLLSHSLPPPQAHDQISSMWKELESVRKKLEDNSLKTIASPITLSPVSEGVRGWSTLLNWLGCPLKINVGVVWYGLRWYGMGQCSSRVISWMILILKVLGIQMVSFIFRSHLRLAMMMQWSYTVPCARLKSSEYTPLLPRPHAPLPVPIRAE